ncbi:hypothetical protein [Actinomadura kijaniata]|uniref:hypothetical protein n=1 Tax=Actinomadura kijaniata TaxID=46161 RepID=UPI000831EE59|nr:hypothetical protein [Actinomadura kijaniata]
MSNSYRSHRRRKKSKAGRLGLAGALTGAVGIAAVAAGIVLMRPDDRRTGTAIGQAGGGEAATPSATAAPPTGPVLSLTTPEGYGYGLAAVKAGTDEKPLATSEATADGKTFAYADYVLTNTGRRPALLPNVSAADLFVPASQVPDGAKERCMPQAGVPSHMCTLPNHSKVLARLDGSRPPFRDGADTMIPGGASYLVRVATDLPVKDGLEAGDIRLYVWDARYTPERKGIEVAFP